MTSFFGRVGCTAIVAIFLAPGVMAGQGAAAPTAGQAVGSLVAGGQSVKLAHAAAFVDQKDSRKPVILLLTDQPVPVNTLASEFDLMGYRRSHPFKGVAFYLDKAREVFRTEYYLEEFPTAVMGAFELKLEGPPGKALVGTAASSGKDPRLDAKFHAALK